MALLCVVSYGYKISVFWLDTVLAIKVDSDVVESTLIAVIYCCTLAFYHSVIA